MKIDAIESMPPSQRRRLLKWGLAALSGPAVPASVRVAFGELVMGRAHAADAAALAAASEPSYFIEIDLRDQMDWGHVFVAPGLVGDANIKRGSGGNLAALFFTQDELRGLPGGVFLTADSAELAPHADTIAFVDTCELTSGKTHGHEAGNPTRLPGKVRTRTAGTLAVYERDGMSPGEGNEAFFANTPTPASLHNFVQKTLSPALRNGVALKFLGRGKHTVYHFAAGLSGGELDRIRSRAELGSAFPGATITLAPPAAPGTPTAPAAPAPAPVNLNVVDSANDAAALRAVLERIDGRFLRDRRYAETALASHRSNLLAAEKQLHGVKPVDVVLDVSSDELTYWSTGVPRQVSSRPVMPIWEQAAVAFKLLKSGATRSVAIEFCYEDVHGRRSEDMMRTYARQTAIPLARLIRKLKDAGMYERTVIAIYTLDGGRPLDAGQSGDRGKNSVILAGGRVKGGYFGDIRLSRAASGSTPQQFSYHAPDLVTGAPGPGMSSTDNTMRLASAALWRTVMKAAGIPDALCDTFGAVAAARPLPFMLRG
jgi:hypothetical protein